MNSDYSDPTPIMFVSERFLEIIARWLYCDEFTEKQNEAALAATD